MNDTARPWSEARGITLWRLFRAFAFVGISGFGGVLPIFRYELVDRRGWLSNREFAEILSMCQFLPGPNVVNMSITFGMRVSGIRGAIVALFGLMTMPVAIVLTLAVIYAEISHLEVVRNAFRGIAAAAAGLLVAMGARMTWEIIRIPRAMVIMGIVFVAMIVLRLPLVTVLLTLAPISIFLAWWLRDG